MTKNTRILLVEDDDDIGNAVCELLEDEGYEVERVSSLQAANDRLSNPDGAAVALVDLLLDGQSLEPVLDALRDSRSSIPMIIISAKSDAAAVAARHGVAFLRKAALRNKPCTYV